MDSDPTQTNTKYQQVTVDVPDDRIAEFHVFFGRFLAAAAGDRSRRGRRRNPRGARHGHAGRHGHRCAGRHQATPTGEATTQQAETTEV